MTSETLGARPTLLFFLLHDCASGKRNGPKIEGLRRQLAGKVEVVAFYIGAPADVRKEAKQLGLRFPVVPDPKAGISARFGIKRTLSFTVLNGPGVMPKMWDAVNQANFAEALGWLRKEDVAVPKVDLTAFDMAPDFGCYLSELLEK